MNKDDEIAALKARIEALEDVLLELAPFAGCYNIEIQTTFRGVDDASVRAVGVQFKRDTLYMNKHAFRRAAALIRDKVEAAGMHYVFEN